MNKGISIKKLVEKFWLIEQQLNLLDYQIEEVKIWQYLRHRIFLILAQKVGLYAYAHIKKNSLTELLKSVPSLFYYSLFSNPLCGSYQKDILVFSAGRKVKVDGKFIDIYSEYLVNELPENSYEIIEELYLNKHLPADRKNRKHQDYQQVRSFLKSKLSRFRFNDEQLKSIDVIEAAIKSELNVELELIPLFRNGILMFKYDYEFYDKLLKKRKPKQVILVCSYVYKLALIAAAKKNKIETIEMQHATIDKFHVGYSFPNQKNIDYYPDKIYFFGEYWKESAPIPLSEENKVVYGFPYFQKQKKNFENIQKQKRTVLVISQGTIGKKLSEFVWECKDELKDFRIVYKLHPGEYERWKNDYPELLKLAQQKNVTVVDNNDTNLYEFFAQSEYVIGVYSTAVFEALSFECKVMLVNLPGIEFLEDLIKKDFVKLLKNKENLAFQLSQGDFKRFDSKMFFA